MGKWGISTKTPKPQNPNTLTPQHPNTPKLFHFSVDYMANQDDKIKIISDNRQARHLYEILEGNQQTHRSSGTERLNSCAFEDVF